MRKIYTIAAIACLFAACKPSVSVTTPPSAGTADFTNYLAIGNSLTSGYADGALTVTGQLNSYPQRLFEQFQLVTKTKGTFIQPLVTGNDGYPSPKLVLATLHSACNYADSNFGPVRFSGPLDSLGSYHFTSNINNGQINNIGVPYIRCVDYLVPNYALVVNAAYNLPFALRFYKNPAGSPLDELQYRVNNLHPTFFTMWLGANDVLGYALAGGQGDGTGYAVPLVPGTTSYASNDISPYAQFDTCYDRALNMAISTGSGGALINIPDITSLPYFNVVPANGLVLTRQGQADSLQTLYSVYKAVFQVGTNYFMIRDHNDNIRQAVKGELLLMTVPTDSLKCFGMGALTPIPKQYVLTTDEIQNINAATTSYNNFIKYEATLHHLAYIDMNSFLKTISTGYVYNGITYSTQYISGGAFSLDGIHLTQRGYALVANQILQGINGAPYHASIPLLDVNRYHGIDFP
jgi:lysophospholipase L1-like esterase